MCIMVDIEKYKEALELKKLGYSAKIIADKLKVNICTINNWNISRGNIKYEKIIKGDYNRVKIDESTISPIEYLKTLSKLKDDKELFKTYSYIFGLYLGDGCISKLPRTKTLSIALDIKYKNLNMDVINNFKLLFNDVKVIKRKGNCINVRYSNCNLGILFPQDSSGLKCDRKINIEEWQSKILDPIEFLRGLIMSDGSYYMRKSNKKFEYNFANCSIDIINMVCKCLDILHINYGLRYLLTKNKNYHNSYKISIVAKESVDVLHYYIGDKENIVNRNNIENIGYYYEYDNVISYRTMSHTKLSKNKI